MKAILYGVAILVAGGASVFSYMHSTKFKALESERIEAIAVTKKLTADADVADKKIKDERVLLAASQDKKELATQSVSALTSTANSLANDSSRLDGDMKVQDEEFALLQSALEEVNTILADLAVGVTLETLPETIQKIEEDKVAKIAKLEELGTVVAGAKKSLAVRRAEEDRLAQRAAVRNANISRNSMEAVITAVNQDWGFVVIGAGSNSNFTPQTSLLVQRDGRMIGRVRPSSIEPTQTIAEVDLKSLAPGVRLQAGDRVILAKPFSN